MPKRHRSYIKWFDNNTGFGFLHPPEGMSDDIAILFSSVVDAAAGEFVELQPGDVLTFEVEYSDKGVRARDARRDGRVLATAGEWLVLSHLTGSRARIVDRIGGYSIRMGNVSVSKLTLEALLEKELVQPAGTKAYKITKLGRQAYQQRRRELE